MSHYTYFKILKYKDCTLTALSESDVDNCEDSLEVIIKRCGYWHREKLLNSQLVIVKFSRWENEIIQTLNPPLVHAIVCGDKQRFKEWNKRMRKNSSNLLCIHIKKYTDIKDYTFDHYHILDDCIDITELKRIESEVKCRCRSVERQLAVQSSYFKRMDTEG
jgi:hypothetical protein